MTFLRFLESSPAGGLVVAPLAGAGYPMRGSRHEDGVARGEVARLR